MLYNWVRSPTDTVNAVLVGTMSRATSLAPVAGTAVKWGRTANPATPIDQTTLTRVAHLGLMLPFTNLGVELAGMSWKQVICGAQLAVAHVNAGNESVVPGLSSLVSNLNRLDSSMYDTGCTACEGSNQPFNIIWPLLTRRLTRASRGCHARR